MQLESSTRWYPLSADVTLTFDRIHLDRQKRKNILGDSCFWQELDSSKLWQGIVVSEEVAKALRDGSPVVALESTIISHGMPFPQNLETALEVRATIPHSLYCFLFAEFT